MKKTTEGDELDQVFAQAEALVRNRSPITDRQRRVLRRYQELDECWTHNEPRTKDPQACGCWRAMREEAMQ